MASLRHHLVVTYMQVTQRKKPTAESLHESIRARRKADRPGPPRSLARRIRIERRDDFDFPVYILAPSEGDHDRCVVYIHGGSYVNTLMKQQWAFAATLAKRLDATVITPDYLLAPEHTWRDSFPGMLKLVRQAVDEAASGCTLIGDSSGGGYSLAIAQQFSLAGITSPPLVLIAPFLDLTLADPRCAAIEPADPWHSVEGLREAGRLWAGGDDPSRPEVSPLFGRFSGLGPVLVLSGTRDVLHPQSRCLVEKAAASGVPVEYIEKAGLIHSYPLLPIPEARGAVDRIIDFIAHQ